MSKNSAFIKVSLVLDHQYVEVSKKWVPQIIQNLTTTIVSHRDLGIPMVKKLQVVQLPVQGWGCHHVNGLGGSYKLF